MSEEPRTQDNPLDTLRYGWHLTGDLYTFLHNGLGIYLDIALLLLALLAVLWAHQGWKAHKQARAKRARAAASKARRAAAKKRPHQRKARQAT